MIGPKIEDDRYEMSPCDSAGCGEHGCIHEEEWIDAHLEDPEVTEKISQIDASEESHRAYMDWLLATDYANYEAEVKAWADKWAEELALALDQHVA